MAEHYNFRVEAGASFYLELEYTNDDGSEFDFTDWTPKAQIRRTPSASLALELDTEVNEEESSIIVSMTPGETSTLVSGDYVWALELSNSDTGAVVRAVEGGGRVSAEVVRDES